jgi:hypothetical protein
MTSILVNESEDPRLHAFIIGAGRYTYLKGGDGLPLPMQMGQLDAAPISALALVDWLIREYSGPVRLGTIELLLSASDSHSINVNGNDITVSDRADSQAIEDAFDRWKVQCDKNDQNVALFFFCGHGIEKGDLFLLLEDFGKRPNARFSGSFNFHQFYQGMRQCNSSAQLYFVDSCRSIPKLATDREVTAAKILIEPLVFGKARKAPIFYSTATNSTAWAPTDGQKTRFTDMLIQCLNGMASQKQQNRWVVTSGQLESSMMSLLNADPVQGQLCTCDGERTAQQTINILSSDPTVPVRIGANPNAVLQRLKFKLTSALHKREFVRDPSAQPWSLTVPAASYILSAEMSDQSRLIPSEEVYACPPMFERTLEIV